MNYQVKQCFMTLILLIPILHTRNWQKLAFNLLSDLFHAFKNQRVAAISLPTHVYFIYWERDYKGPLLLPYRWNARWNGPIIKTIHKQVHPANRNIDVFTEQTRPSIVLLEMSFLIYIYFQFISETFSYLQKILYV